MKEKDYKGQSIEVNLIAIEKWAFIGTCDETNDPGSQNGDLKPLVWARQERGWLSCCGRSSPDSLVLWPISVVGTSWGTRLADIGPRAS